MANAEERINQLFDKEIELCKPLWRQPHMKARAVMLETTRKKVLQILADSKIIPLKEWRELLKLLKHRKKIFSEVAEDCRKEGLEQKHFDSMTLLQRNAQNYAVHMAMVGLIEKIEAKLEDLGK